MIDALLELCSPFLKGGNPAFIAVIVTASFYKNEYGRLEQLRLEQLRLEQLRPEQLRPEQLRLEQLRLEWAK